MFERTEPRILLEGRPGVGKTTMARRLIGLLREAGIPVAGFTTVEIREGRRRVGFAVEDVRGRRATMAHVDLPGPPTVGRYGVDLAAFEEIGVPAIEDPPPRGWSCWTSWARWSWPPTDSGRR